MMKMKGLKFSILLMTLISSISIKASTTLGEALGHRYYNFNVVVTNSFQCNPCQAQEFLIERLKSYSDDNIFYQIESISKEEAKRRGINGLPFVTITDLNTKKTSSYTGYKTPSTMILEMEKLSNIKIFDKVRDTYDLIHPHDFFDIVE